MQGDNVSNGDGVKDKYSFYTKEFSIPAHHPILTVTPAEISSSDPVGLDIISGTETVTIFATSLISTATNSLEFKVDLSDEAWSNLYTVTGVTETNWILAVTNQSFFQITTDY